MATRDVETRWERLTEQAKDSFRWALAFETGPPVGSRGMLLGVIRAGGPTTPANILLKYFGVSYKALAQALAQQNRSPLDPGAEKPRAMTSLPVMTGNADRCLFLASSLQEDDPNRQIDLPEIFGGLMMNPRATATRALDSVIADMPIGDIARNYQIYLSDGMLGSYEKHLAHWFPRTAQGYSSSGPPEASSAPPDPSSAPPPTSSEPPPQPDAPWSRLMVLERSARSPLGFAVRDPIQLGLLIDQTTLATCSDGMSFGEYWAKPANLAATGDSDDGGEPLAFTIAQTGVKVTLLRSASPMRLPVGAISFGESKGKQACEVAGLDPVSLAVTRLAGDIEESGQISLHKQPARTTVLLGSPVVVDGTIVGMVTGVNTDASIWATGAGEVQSLTTAAERQRAAIGTQSGAGNDVVGTVDQLGFDGYVHAFVELIMSENTQLPLTIGIYGSWGAGKSFLLRHIQDEIEARQRAPAKPDDARPNAHVLRFNAWEYSATDAIWPGLVRKIMTKLDEIAPCSWLTRLWTRVKWNLPRETRRLRVPLTAAALVVAAGAIVTAIADQTKIAALIGAAGVVGLGGGSLLKAANNPAARWVVGLFSDTSYGGEIGLMADIKHDLETLEARLHEHGDAGQPALGRIVILIDDLDRCEPAKAVEVLQAVNLLLNFDSFVVCLGIDARIVTTAIESHYDGLLKRAGASGYEYLEKIVQIPFRIPTPGPDELVGFVRQQLGVDETEPAAGLMPAAPESVAGAEQAPPVGQPSVTEPHRTTPVEQLTAPGSVVVSNDRSGDQMPLVADAPSVSFTAAERAAFELLTPYLRPNPRHVKRLVNVYRLVRALAQYHGDDMVLADPAATIRWLMMWAQWPYCSLMMIRRFDELKNPADSDLSMPLPIGDPLQVLFKQVEKDLDHKISAQLDDPRDNLRKLLSVDGCSLDWRQIQDILRYTVNFNPAVEEQLGAGV